ncbi:MAG: restriction endonuclease [Acidobacteria bacterium]|nr:restriction endonuclease [Acidobacteriota bacterium]
MKSDKLITTAEDLLTSRDETRAGFIAMALEKNYLATKYVSEARTLKAIAESAGKPKDLLTLPDIQKALLSASGLSDKSLKHLNEADKRTAVVGLIETFLEPAGEGFPDELVYRYLLTKGDALGGSSRNLAGALGDRRFLSCMISVFSLAGVEFSWRDRKTKVWAKGTDLEAGLEKSISALYWKKKDRDRLLVLNTTVPLIRKNVDLVILDAKPDDMKAGKSLFEQNTRYVALGELKGGIDPAGSDEHWKTANFALNRVRSSFQGLGLNPPTFFIGAAIEKSMAGEILQQLNSKVLSQAANLTKDDQLTSVCNWIMNL